MFNNRKVVAVPQTNKNKLKIVSELWKSVCLNPHEFYFLWNFAIDRKVVKRRQCKGGLHKPNTLGVRIESLRTTDQKGIRLFTFLIQCSLKWD